MIFTWIIFEQVLPVRDALLEGSTTTILPVVRTRASHEHRVHEQHPERAKCPTPTPARCAEAGLRRSRSHGDRGDRLGRASETDPFVLLMDDRVDFAPGQKIGGPHPHAGLETVTLVLEGSLDDRDEGVLQAGDVAWMTAGRGVIHNEEVHATGRARILQLWVTLPESARDAAPRLQVLRRAEMPVHRAPGVEARLYGGRSNGLASKTLQHVAVTLVDLALEPGAAFTQELPSSYNGFLLPISGAVTVGDDSAPLGEGEIGWSRSTRRPLAPAPRRGRECPSAALCRSETGRSDDPPRAVRRGLRRRHRTDVPRLSRRPLHEAEPMLRGAAEESETSSEPSTVARFLSMQTIRAALVERRRRSIHMSWHIDDVHTHHQLFGTAHDGDDRARSVQGTAAPPRSIRTTSPSPSSRARSTSPSIDTGNAQRDNHLRASDFFDAPNYPTITFKSQRIESKGDGEYVVHGDLTIRGVTKPVALDVEFLGTSKNPWGKTVAGVSVRASINRKDFGVSYNAMLEARRRRRGREGQDPRSTPSSWLRRASQNQPERRAREELQSQRSMVCSPLASKIEGPGVREPNDDFFVVDADDLDRAVDEAPAAAGTVSAPPRSGPEEHE